VPPPTERIASAEAALRGAAEVGASRVPRAALHLKLAEEQIDKAKRYIQDGYNQRAELALRRAQADAELALVLAREQHTLEKTQAAQQNLEKLKAQYGR
jgi:Spy/CpxP family protein refolding chaperone